MNSNYKKISKLNYEYSLTKFRYLCLKLQNGGYTENTATHLTAATIAVINCTYYNTNQKSVDCVTIVDNTQKINLLNDELVKLETEKGIKAIKRKLEIRSELDKLMLEKNKINTRTDTPDVNKRTCDKILSTVASVYLSIIYNTNKNTFITLMNDLINAKINNCEIAKRTEEKKYEIIKYFLNIIQKMNELLYLIDKQNGVSYQDIFTNAEYGKQDKKAIEKLREKGIKISKDDEEYFRMVNDFIGSKLDKIKFININEIISQINNASPDNKKKLILEFELSENKNIKNTEMKPNKFIVYGVYKFDRNNNSTIVENIITHEQRNKY